MARCKMIGSLSTGALSISRVENSSSILDKSTLTYIGIINENDFQLESQTDKVFDIEISQAETVNPINKERELWLGFLTKSVYDGVGLRQPIDIAVCLDISGSMSATAYDCKTRINLAIDATIHLLDLLNKNDNIALTTFASESTTIFPLTSGNKTKQFINKIKQIKSGGGTDIYLGYLNSYNILNKSTNKRKRIMLITDMENSDYCDKLKKLVHQSSNEEIYTTIIGISDQCNTSLMESVIHCRGNNYFVAAKGEDIEKYFVKDFTYICFPSAYNININFKSSNIQVIKCIGTGFNKPQEVNCTEWKVNNHLHTTQSFQSKVNFLLFYFNRIKKKLPMPVLSTVCNYLRYDKNSVCKVNTAFPSEVIIKGNKRLVKGGLILLKLNKLIQLQTCSCEIEIQYTTVDGNKEIIRKPIIINFNAKGTKEHFSNKVIKKGMGLYYFAKYLRVLMRNGKSNIVDHSTKANIINTSSDVMTYLTSHCNKNNCNLTQFNRYVKILNSLVGIITGNEKQKEKKRKSNPKEIKNKMLQNKRARSKPKQKFKKKIKTK